MFGTKPHGSGLAEESDAAAITATSTPQGGCVFLAKRFLLALKLSLNGSVWLGIWIVNMARKHRKGSPGTVICEVSFTEIPQFERLVKFLNEVNDYADEELDLQLQDMCEECFAELAESYPAD